MPAYMPAADDSAEMTELTDPRRRRLLFRAHHRGTKETDLLVGGFVARHIHDFSEAELDELEAVLELLDVDLADWLSGRRPIPPEVMSPMLARMAEESMRPGAGVPPGLAR
jgi:antitoxin CptB